MGGLGRRSGRTRQAITAGATTLQARFHYFNADFDWWWQVDSVQIGSVPTCEPMAGAFLMGYVSDANTGAPMLDAQVSAGMTLTVYTEATPDPALADGFYMLFLPEGVHTVQASFGGGYGPQEMTGSVSNTTPLWHDFALVAPSTVTLTLERDERITVPLTITNAGALTLTVFVNGVNAPLPMDDPLGPFAPSMRRVSPKHLEDRTAEAVYAPPPPDVPQWPGGGKVLARWCEPLTMTMRIPHAPARFWADAVFQPFDGRLWQVAVGGEPCIVALDVATGQASERICPGVGMSQRGLAYDPTTGTFYSGSWNDGVIHQFDETGQRLRSVAVGIPVAGMAFNPATQHLFVLANDDEGFDVYVLDAAHDLAILGGFDVPGLDAFEQAGMALLCNGVLAITAYPGFRFRKRKCSCRHMSKPRSG